MIFGSEAAAARAAIVQPTSGSVTQSSDSSANPSGIPTSNDVVTVTVGYDTTTQKLTYRATYNGREVVDTRDSTEASGIEHLVNQGVGVQRHEFLTVPSWRGVEFYRHLSAEEIDTLEGNPAGTNGVNGQLWVDIYTDYDVTADANNDGTVGDDTDYIAGGLWVYRDDDATSLDDYEYGAFADVSDPFEQANLGDLTGTARYIGSATGVYADARDTGRNYFFDADVELTANFDNDTISGRIDNFSGDDVTITGSPVLRLADAPIGGTDSGFFTGDTSLRYEGEDYTGKWGGQFAGNGRNDGMPGSVGGTFGGATADGYEGFLGVFGAHFNEDQ
ncbi:MAG: hypothetical protein OXL96_14455 [Candidatus Poribacteria bacterium]|nr:hypothetical protein [Candidatus Poribacteria bacterium]